MITSQQLKKKYLEFFQKKGHAIIPSASLIPENDPTVLFTTAGMHPLVPYLLGEKHPSGKRLVNVQKCIRTGDIDEVGDDVHLTFFEMLGNWSLGDYWKKEAITWSLEFLTQELNIPVEKLAVSCFAGDKDAPRDEESAKIWESLKIPRERIYFFGKEDNWWGPAGKTGPCGPDTEMFYWTGKGKPPKLTTGDNSSGWVEIWNDVFMQYNKTAAGEYEPLKQKNVDTGMGVERTVAVLSGKDNIFETKLFQPIISAIEKLANQKDQKRAIRIITDHLRAATFILGDEKGIQPSNVEQGYVLRRLIRRAVRYGKIIGIDKIFTFEIAKVIIKEYSDDYPELKNNKDFIEEQLIREEEKFGKTLEKGLKELEKLKPKREQIPLSSLSSKSFMVEYGLSENVLFNLYSTYGFPIEMSLEEIKKMYQEFNRKQGVEITELPKDDEKRLTKQFHEALQKHQELSRTATAGKFKGGLADHSEIATKYHTATHLLLAALRQVLGKDVYQKGSNITAERLRLDFSHSEKLTEEQKQKVEQIVNEQIKANLPITKEEMTLDEAKKLGAMGVFDHKYGDKVKVYTIGDPKNPFSREICGGPHAQNTAELKSFKIQKEEASSAGIRRIKAIIG